MTKIHIKVVTISISLPVLQADILEGPPYQTSISTKVPCLFSTTLHDQLPAARTISLSLQH